MTYALDTNIISYLIQENKTVEERLNNLLKQGNMIVIPPTTYYEIKRGFKHKSAPKKEYAFSLVCKLFPIGEMNIKSWERAADVYAEGKKTGKTIEDTDILVAAFCIVNGYTLATNNSKHFKDIGGLIWENWL
jgi:tRNA(fMet)-specific endonuclease VapC